MSAGDNTVIALDHTCAVIESYIALALGKSGWNYKNFAASIQCETPLTILN